MLKLTWLPFQPVTSTRDDATPTDETETDLGKSLATRSDVQKVALLFDESHSLLREEFGLKAFRSRCMRQWVREQRIIRIIHVVAVFAGTNSRFCGNSQPPISATDDDGSMPSSSRRGQTEHLPLVVTMNVRCTTADLFCRWSPVSFDSHLSDVNLPPHLVINPKNLTPKFQNDYL